MKAEILAALKEAAGYVSGQKLCGRLGVSRTAVWKGIQKLREDGYRIEAVSNKGYFLAESPDMLNAQELKSIRKTKWAGREIVYYDTADSTNMRAKHLAENGAIHGTLVVAGRQESGKGRRGRSWESPDRSGIFMTLLLRPDFSPGRAHMLTIVAAMAVAKAIRTQLSLPAQIKWPNDIVLNGKKVCGILTELSTEIDAIHYVIIGIGINVSNREFGDEIAGTATSLLLEGGGQVSRAGLIEAVWEQFELYYEKFAVRQDLSGIREEYGQYLVNRDRSVHVLDPKDPFFGTARGITEEGALIVEQEGRIRLVSSGEVSVRGIYGYT